MSTRPSSKPPLRDPAESVDRLEKVLRVGCEFHETMSTAGGPAGVDELRSPKLGDTFAQGPKSFEITILTQNGDQTVKYDGAQFGRQPQGVGTATWTAKIANKTFSYAYNGFFTRTNKHGLVASGNSTTLGYGILKVDELDRLGAATNGLFGQAKKTMIVEGQWSEKFVPYDVYVEIVDGENVIRIQNVSQKFATDSMVMKGVLTAFNALDASSTRGAERFESNGHFSIEHWAFGGKVETMQGEVYKEWSQKASTDRSSTLVTQPQYLRWFGEAGLSAIPDVDDFEWEASIQLTPRKKTDFWSLKVPVAVRGQYFYMSPTECGWRNSSFWLPTVGYIERYNYPMLVRNETTGEWDTFYNKHADELFVVATWWDTSKAFVSYIFSHWKTGSLVAFATIFASVFLGFPNPEWFVDRVKYRQLMANTAEEATKDIVLKPGFVSGYSADLTMMAACSRTSDLPVVAASANKIFIWKEGFVLKESTHSGRGRIKHIALLPPLVVACFEDNKDDMYVYNCDQNRRQKSEISNNGVTAMAASPDGNLLVVAYANPGQARFMTVFDLENATLQPRANYGLDYKAEQLVVSNMHGEGVQKALVLLHRITAKEPQLAGMQYKRSTDIEIKTPRKLAKGGTLKTMAVTKTGSHWIYFALSEAGPYYVVGGTAGQDLAEYFPVKWPVLVRSVAFNERNCAYIGTEKEGLYVLNNAGLKDDTKRPQQEAEPNEDGGYSNVLSVQHMTTQYDQAKPGRIVTLREQNKVVIHNNLNTEQFGCG